VSDSGAVNGLSDRFKGDAMTRIRRFFSCVMIGAVLVAVAAGCSNNGGDDEAPATNTTSGPSVPNDPNAPPTSADLIQKGKGTTQP
jgi:hypothetical protein